MISPRHDLAATAATALLALALTTVSPAVADGVTSDDALRQQGTYATPASAPTALDSAAPTAPPSDEASPAPEPSSPAPEPSSPAPVPSPSPAPEPPAPKPDTGSWSKDSVGWKYVFSDGTAVTNQVKGIDGVTYAFDGTGHIARGWYRNPQGSWYLSTDHGVRTGWQRDRGTWYYLGSSGAMRTGWVQDGARWYHLSSSGAMTTGWLHSGEWYYLDPSGGGAMATGWQRDRGTWYYLGSSGAMRTGWQRDGDTWYYLGSSGAMRTGWVQDGARWYHLSSSGAMTTGWLHSGEWYYLDPSGGGAMATGWRSIGGQRNYFDAWDGFWVTDRASFATGWAYAKTLYSPTNYLIVVDTSAPHCMSFYWRNGAWQPHHDWPCSVGASSTPTVRGTFSIGSRGRSFGSGYTAYWWTQFHGDYLFHSIIYNQGTYTVKDGTLGGHVSHGCVRMRIQDAKWIYDNIPSRTRVVVY
ncbi:L,D-transpeptidase family protein [Actinomyces trachealis]|uniref:L,D-transpeptidase family protein n=1 Tax=Actinomyces trachealis TaxID=2763540 RepID=UPI001892B1D9|nr:L,D-transpeptidase [Actinomyces trachealis]